MFTTIRRRLMPYGLLAALLVSILPLAAVQLSAQVTLGSTTTSAALTAQSDRVTLASGAGVVAGVLLYIDREAMEVVEAISSTTFRVRRGVSGSYAAAHASGAPVYSGVPSAFAHSDVSGPCVATSEPGLPRINIDSGNMFQCSAGFWRVYRTNGIRDFQYSSLANGGTTYTTAGAITIEPGFVFLGSAGALAMTLANPTTDQNGMVMCIITQTAQAHTVTYTAGFGGGTTARDVATFTAAINNGFCIVANAGIWWPVPTVAGVAFA